MKQGRSLQDLVIELDRQNASKLDFTAATPLLRMNDDGKTLEARDTGAYPLTDLALTQIGDRVGIPTRYLRTMQAEAPELLAHNVNHWFDKKPETRLVRTLDGNARAFLSNRYQRIDNHDVALAALPVLREIPGLRIVSSEVTENRLYIKAVTSEIRGEVKSRRVGDFVEAGVLISNSEVGLGAVSVKGFANFLICTNGMVRDKGTRWNHVGRRADDSEGISYADDTRQADDRAVLLKIRDTVKHVLSQSDFDAWIARLDSATGQVIEGDVPAAIEVLGKGAGFSGEENSQILRHLIEGGDLSRYGLIQAVTRTAEDATSYDRATELESAGGALLAMTMRDWGTIAHAKAA